MANEKRLIDANALYQKIKETYDLDGGEILTDPYWFADMVDNAPTVDAVPVVRCKDCKHYNQTMNECESLHFWFSEDGGLNVKEDDFCSYGERREGE